MRVKQPEGWAGWVRPGVLATVPHPEGATAPEHLELVLLIGLPASGKSTFYRQRLAATHGVISKELMVNVRQKGARQLELTRAALAAGHSTVIDDVNARAQDRAPLIALGRELGARVLAFFFSSRVTECLQRNRERAAGARLRESLILEAARQIERPRRTEGFDELHQVLLRPGGYEVREYREP